MTTTAAPSAAAAAALDAADELASFRGQFALPRDGKGRELAYLCGHSLGLAPLEARARVLEEIADWENLAVLGHEHGHRAWIGYAEALRPLLAPLAGADPSEVIAMNSLTVNLHLLLASFYRPKGDRRRILIEAGAFPSDRHLVESQLRWHGLDPADALVELAPRAGEDLLHMDDLLARVHGLGHTLALVLWPGVQYRTGQAFELAPIVRAAHAAGAFAGFDLAHAIGNLPLALHDSGADFAAWCSYKYLNGGPGAIGGAYVHERHARSPSLPRLAGWWGSDPATRFAMSGRFELTPGAAGWQVSNPPILSAAPLHASLRQFAAAGMPRLRAKSRSLTAFLREAIEARCGAAVSCISPAGDGAGCQLSVRLDADRAAARSAFDALAAQGVVADWREPDTIRLAPVPLYNTHGDCWRAACALGAALHG